MATNGAMHRTQIFLPLSLHRRLKEEASSRQITLSELIRKMLTRQLHRSSRDRTEAGIRVLLSIAGEGGRE